MKKMNVLIRLEGCDDTTSFIQNVSEEGLNTLREVAQMSKKISTYGCMPTMELTVEPKCEYCEKVLSEVVVDYVFVCKDCHRKHYPWEYDNE